MTNLFNMKNKGLLIIPTLIAIIIVPTFLSARENVGMSVARKNSTPSLLSTCVTPTAQADLAVNNVRARMLCGDMWWDLTAAVYEVPKGGKSMAIFAGSLWIGGIDLGSNLRVAAATYRQTGNDFWPGPLDTTDATVSKDVCAKFDKHFRITRKAVDDFVTTGTITKEITDWPGNGDQSLGQSHFLAPFFDKNADGIYDPSVGDYPGFDLVAGDKYGDCQINQCIPVDQLYGDECIWWVFNDKGNIHGETGAKEIGLEVRTQAFGFFTDDEINNMTFYNYRIFNRSTYEIDTCYFGVWCDADLGCYDDDYVGCDVSRGLGYTYNGDNDDNVACKSPGYGPNPPAVGIDFFRGPIADKNDKIDNDRNCKKDEPCEQIIMSGFLYYDNTNGVPYGNPSGATHFYNYLRSKWGDGTPVQYGKNGYQTGAKDCKFMYPGNPSTDLYDWGIGGSCLDTTKPTLPGWDEVTAGNTPGDRRMLQSAGPFTLKPGALNVITTGVVWARAVSGGSQASVSLLRKVDDKAQALFDNCFKVLDGPDAPDMTIQEMDKKLIIYLTNTNPGSNNFNETYQEIDPLISVLDTGGHVVKVDTTYNFEGYKIYQVKDKTVSAADIEDPNKSRLIAQTDVKNGIKRIVNFEFNQGLGGSIPVEKVDGKDLGLVHSILVTKDAFADGDAVLINHKSYYFLAVAYGYNQFKEYRQDLPPSANPLAAAYDGQKKPYKQGRKNIYTYTGIPHIFTQAAGGTEAHGSYGSGPMITRIEGNGNGDMILEMTSSSINAIMASPTNRILNPTYEYGAGPVNIKVVDPLNVPDGGEFIIKFDSTTSITYIPNSGTFVLGETITGGQSKASAVIANDNGSKMHIINIKGAFISGEMITGGTSSALGKISLFATGDRKNKSLYKSSWSLTNTKTGEIIWSDKTIAGVNEQLIPKLGLSISIAQIFNPGESASNHNGFQESSITFADPTKKWLSGIADQDGATFYNWIRSGTAAGDAFTLDYTGVDNSQAYEGVVNGTWAPYRLVACSFVPFDPSKYYTGPGFSSSFMNKTSLRELASVNIVLTSDKSKWSRAVVLEMAEDSSLTLNKTKGEISTRARKLDFRRAPSVDKNGVANYPAADNNDFSTGMGWFPGYAINLETGERLNIAFGENSALSGGVYEQHGADMLWNPTSKTIDSIPWDAAHTGPVFGGQHYIYVFGHNAENSFPPITPTDTVNIPRYDRCNKIRTALSGIQNSTTDKKIKMEIFRDVMWVNIPMLATGHSLLETDVTVKLRVGKPYMVGYSSAYYRNGNDTIYTDTTIVPGGGNRNLPTYSFTTTGIATHVKENEIAMSALDLINVVPNPYYAYSDYERNVIDNRVKITNIPETCNISIYNLSGALVRKFNKGEQYTKFDPSNRTSGSSRYDGTLDWDLKNSAGIPIASGVYIIHVEIPGVGERTIKWFGVMRPIDLDSF